MTGWAFVSRPLTVPVHVVLAVAATSDVASERVRVAAALVPATQPLRCSHSRWRKSEVLLSVFSASYAERRWHGMKHC